MFKEVNICNGKDDVGCGGEIIADRHDGRFYLHKEVYINIDKDITIPRCNKCGTYYHSKKLVKFLDGILNYEYDRHRNLIQEAFERDRYRA